MKFDYFIVVDNDIQDFIAHVKRMINEDWSLLGSPFVEKGFMHQALTKVIKEKNDPDRQSCVKGDETIYGDAKEAQIKREYPKCHFCGEEMFGAAYLSNCKGKKFCSPICFNMKSLCS